MAARAAEGEIVPEIDFREIISINVRFLRGLGIIKPEEKSTSQTLWYYLRAGVILATASMVISEVVNIIMVIGDLEKLAEASFLALGHLSYVYKLYPVYKYENKLTSLINSLNRSVFQPKSMNQYYSLKSHIHESKIISKIILSACACIAGMWAVYPFFEGGNISLPLAGWFPFDTTYSPVFEIVYMYQMVVNSAIGFSNISLDTFISGLIMAVCSQLNILSDSLKNIREHAEMELDDNGELRVLGISHGISPELQKKMDEKLVQCIVHHKCILEFAEEIKFVFSIGMLGQFIIGVVTICVTLFEIMLLPWKSMQFISIVMYQLCILLEIFLLCYYGNEVIIESTKLTTFAYCSDWADCSAQYKRSLLIFMTRSQQEMILYAGGFVVLSLETFVQIMKSSWSCFAFLNTIKEE